MRVKQTKFHVILITITLLILNLTGCDSSSDEDKTGYVQFYNASKNAPAVFLTIDEDLDYDESDEIEITYRSTDYGNVTPIDDVVVGDYYYELAWQDEESSDRDSLEVLLQSDLKISNDTIHFVALSGDISTPAVHIYDIDVIDDDEDDTSSLFNFRMLNMHDSNENIDVYISKSEETFNEAELLGQYAYAELSINHKFEQDSYIFYITKAGSEEVIYTSDEIDYSYSSQYVMVVRENIANDASPYALDKVSSSSVVEYLDYNGRAQFSIYNALNLHELIADYTGMLNVYINGIDGSPEVDALSLGTASAAIIKDSGDYSIDVNSSETGTRLLSNHLLSLPENSNKTLFLFSNETAVDEDGDGDVDEDGDGLVDQTELTVQSLVVDNSTKQGVYDHSVNIINLVDNEDYSVVNVYFVRNSETIETAFYNRSVAYTKPESVSLLNNTYQIFVVANDNGSDIILSTIDLTLDSESKELFLLIENDTSSPTGYKLTLINQID